MPIAYEANNAAEFICEDVTNIEGTELNQRYPDNVVRALVGCAPCQPFSRYSSRYRKEGHTDNKWRLLYSFERSGERNFAGYCFYGKCSKLDS